MQYYFDNHLIVNNEIVFYATLVIVALMTLLCFIWGYKETRSK